MGDGPKEKVPNRESGDKSAKESSRRTGISIKVFGRTDVGLVREHNEDNFLVADLETGNRSLLPEVRDHHVGEKGTLLAVCDGMGGAAAGEVASQIAVDTVYDLMQAGGRPENVEEIASRLEDAVLDAGKKIYDSARSDRSRRGMGTTITAAALISEKIIFAQVGDSRAYIIRNKKMVQVTRDQSLVNQLIEAGQLKPEEAELFEHSNIILQALGTAEDVTVDLTFVDLRKGDIVVMCSDGLSGLVSDDEIQRIVHDDPEPINACKTLTAAARDAGGHDNITVIVAHFDGSELKPPKDQNVKFTRYTIPGRPSFVSKQKAMSQGPGYTSAPPEFDDEMEEPGGPVRPVRAVEGEPKEQNPMFIGLLIIVVLAIGVSLGYLFVSGYLGGTQAPPPQNDADVSAAISEPTIACHFSSDVEGTRLVIDGQDYGELPQEGRWISLEPGQHSVEGRYGSETMIQQRIFLEREQERLEFPMHLASMLTSDEPLDGAISDIEVGLSLEIPLEAGPEDAPEIKRIKVLPPRPVQVDASPAPQPVDTAPQETKETAPREGTVQEKAPQPPLTKLPPDQRVPPQKKAAPRRQVNRPIPANPF